MSIRLMTWNVENLFLPQPDEHDAYTQKVRGIANTINALEPEVVALQEIGDSEALQDVIDRLDGHWHVAISSYPDNRGIAVGFISKKILLDVTEIKDLPPQMAPLQTDDERTAINQVGRGGLAATVLADSDELRLVTFHLKSKLITYPGGRFSPHDEDERARYSAYALFRRSAEAATIRTYCNKYLQDQGEAKPLVLLGDSNDEADAATTQILAGPGGSEIGTRGEMREDRGDGSRLFNLAPLLPPDEQQSRKYRGRTELIDHIFLSRALLERIVPWSVRAPRADQLPSIDDHPNQRPQEEISDHSPLLVEVGI